MNLLPLIPFIPKKHRQELYNDIIFHDRDNLTQEMLPLISYERARNNLFKMRENCGCGECTMLFEMLEDAHAEFQKRERKTAVGHRPC